MYLLDFMGGITEHHKNCALNYFTKFDRFGLLKFQSYLKTVCTVMYTFTLVCVLRA